MRQRAPGPRHRRPGQSQGFALLVVLWFLVLLAAIGAYMLAGARAQTALARNLLAGAHAEALADSAIARAAFNQSDPDPRRRWTADGRPVAVTLPGGAATIRLYDETLKINPNLASAPTLNGIFQAVGVDPTKAQSLGALVADWVHPIDPAQANQPGEDPYEAAGRSYRAPHAAVESIDELLLVIGMTPQILTAAKPYLTIFTDQDAPQGQALTQASPVILKALAIAKAAAGASAQGPAAAVPAQPNVPNGSPGQAAPQSQVFSVDATARSADGGTFVRHAVIKLGGQTAQGYSVMDWRRGELAP